MPINEIMQHLEPIQGWFSAAQAEVLYPYIQRQQENALLVEIGTYHGRSTLFFRLANPTMKILTIDPCTQYIANGKYVYPPDRIDDAVLKYGNITQIIGTSMAVKRTFTWPIDVLFIDGDHTYHHLMEDAGWIDLVKPNGLILFHDYKSGHVDVEVAVDELVADKKITMLTAAHAVCVTQKV